MKHIILIDLYLAVSYQVMEKTDVVIEVLLCNMEDGKRLCEKYPDRIKRMLSVKELEEQESVLELDCNAIEEARGVQQKIETQLRRYLTDMNLVKLRYYRGLSFWLGVFRSCEIDGVINIGANHGQLYDGLPVYYAALKKIPSYSFQPFGYKQNFIYDETNQCFVQSTGKNCLNSIPELLKSAGGKYDVYHLQWDEGYTNRGLISFVYKKFGMHTLDLLRAIFLDHSFSKRRELTATSFTSSYTERRKSYRYVKNLERYLKNLEEDPNFSEKYLYLPLQCVPEGRNLNLMVDSQIVLAKMAAEVLPDGWKVYVKEHPHQYIVDNRAKYYYLNFIENFKSKDFYESIKKIPNVSLIKRNVSSEELMNHSKGVVSGLGSVLFEALLADKPMIICDKCHPLAKYKEILRGFEYNGLKNSIEAIKNGYQPDYSDVVKFLDNYVVNEKNGTAENTIRLIMGQ